LRLQRLDIGGDVPSTDLVCVWFRGLLGTLSPVRFLTIRKRRFTVHLVVVASLILGACNGAGGAATTTTAEATTTPSAPPVSSVETLAPGLDATVIDRLTAEIGELAAATEQLRALSFVVQPSLRFLPRDEFTVAVQGAIESDLVKMDPAAAFRLYRMLGLIGSGDDLAEGVFLEMAQEAVVYFDQESGDLLVAGDTAELTPYQRSTVVHELVHALTEQYFRSGRTLAALSAEGSFDQIDAYRALVEGDATYVQFLYLQGLSSEDRSDAALEALDSTPGSLEGAPAFVGNEIVFPYDSGLEFVTALVSGGGIAAIDRAYIDFPVSTEQVIHIERYQGGEAPRRTNSIEVDLPEYQEAAAGTWGELGMIRLLTGVLTPGFTTQTADGWGGDSFLVMENESDVAFVLRYRGDTEDNTIEVVEGLLLAARDRMGAGDGLEAAGGIEFAAGGPYVFIDRVNDGMLFIVSTDTGTGRTIRDQTDVP